MVQKLSIYVIVFLSLIELLEVGQGANPPILGTASWCIARSDASYQALQMALDYACSAGADCVPLQPDGLCYLPNTIQAHASYAFNSYFQRKAMAPGSCDFSGTATVAKTDPSCVSFVSCYGSCVYPSSQSTAGGIMPSTTQPTTPSGNFPIIPPITTTAPPLTTGGGGNSSPGIESPTPIDSRAVVSRHLLNTKITTYASLFMVGVLF